MSNHYQSGLLSVLLLTLPLTVQAQYFQSSDGVSYQLETLTEKLDRPWGMAFVDENRLLVTQKTGTAALVDITDGRVQSVAGVPGRQIDSRGQGGFLDVLNGDDGWWYFTYSQRSDEGSHTALAKAKLVGPQLTQWQTLLVTDAVSDTSRHYGSRLVAGPDGHLYMTVGDRGERDTAQDLTSHHGTVLKIDRSGQAAKGNPFKGTAKAEIWSYGHRNPQGISFDSQGRLWAIEHGPKGGDEVNLIVPGNNYGWPLVSAGREYFSGAKVGADSLPGMTAAAKLFVPSIAPSSLLSYSGKAFPAWKDQLFAGALAKRHLNRMEVLNSGEVVERERLLESLDERIRQVIEGPSGALYLLTDSGKLLRIKP